jgi:hypothetical protein
MAKAAKTQVGRARTIPIMGKQPVLIAGVMERPAETPNPMHGATEPFSFPTARSLMPAPVYESTVPRRVVEAEIDDLLEWGMPRFLHRYPRCTAESVRPLLMVATRGGRYNFLRTASACALFVAETTPWEPLLSVFDVFVVSRPARGPGGRVVDEGAGSPAWQAAKLEVPNLYKAGLAWARDIGAVTYHYGQSTGVDLDPIANEIGHDVREVGYTLILNKVEVAAE